MKAAEGMLVVVSGPSGAGKTSVCRALKEDDRVIFSVSATTRRQRPGERDGIDYHFFSLEHFEQKAGADAFLEWAEYNGNLYGTLRAPMDEALAAGKVFVLEIEVQGTRQLRAARVPGTYVFIVPPDMTTLRQRLVDRGTNTDDEIDERLAIAEQEMAAKDLYDHVVPNRELADTIAAVRQCIGLQS